MKRSFLALVCLIILSMPSFAIFKKKNDEPKLPPMVQTVEEWLEEATSQNMSSRKPDPTEKKEEKFIPPKEKPEYIMPYNVEAGSRELDLTKLYKNLSVRSPFIISPDFKNAVYTETYYYPQRKQTASAIFLIELSNLGDKKERIKKANIFENERFELLSSALTFLKDGFFSAMTVVDFSKDGKKLLVKEKRGSNKYGIYETYAWIFFFDENDPESNLCYLNNKNFYDEKIEPKDEIEEKYETKEDKRWYNTPPLNRASYPKKIKTQKGFPVRLNLLNEMIKAYWFDRKELVLNFVRWDIKPLGFNSSNDDEIVVAAFAYSKEGAEISLGRWAVNLQDGTPGKIEENETVEIGANGFIMVQKLN